MRMNFKKQMFVSLFMPIALGLFPVGISAASIKSDVNVSAETGGNEGGSIATGDAHAESSVENRISGEGSGRISTDIKVRANGETKEVGSDEGGKISVEVREGFAETQAQVSVDDVREEKTEAGEKQEAAIPENPTEDDQSLSILSKTRMVIGSILDWFQEHIP